MSEPAEDPIDVEQWCAGRRYAVTEPLSYAELAVTRRAARRSGWTLVWLVPAAPVVGLALLFLGAWLSTVAPVWINRAWLLCLVVALGLGLPVWALSIRDSWKRCVALHRDTRFGVAWCFESPLETEATGSGPRALKVLPSSLHAFVPGTLTLSELPMTISEVAKGPRYAMRVPVVATSDEENAQTVADFSRRTLNDAEQGELEIAIRRLRWPGAGLLLATLWLVWATLSLRGGPAAFSSATPFALGLSVLCAMAIVRYFRGYALTIKMRRDLRTGWAITAPPKESRAQETPFVEEFLPHSKLMWTVNGTPAGWRDLRRTPFMLRR